MTRDGAVLGTPLYMAPEQHGGEAATPRSDQYAFAVSLWEALAGTHPFLPANRDLVRMRERMGDDDVVGGGALPARIAHALRRALRHDPDARWPDMRALLAELAPRSRRALIWAGAAAAGMIAAIAVTLAITAADDPVATCHAATDRVTAVWPARAPALRRALVESGAPDAAGIADRATRVLDGFAARWRERRHAACEAGYARAEVTPVTRDLQLRCLDDSLRVTAELIDTLVGAEAGRRARVLEVFDALPELEDCATAALAAQPPVPAHAIEELSAARAELARARALNRIGQYRAGRALLEGAVARAEVLGYAPFLAEALLAQGLALSGDGGPRPDELVQRAIELATESHADRTAVTALATALGLAANRPDRSRVELLIPLLRAAARRAGDRALETHAAVVIGTGELVLSRYDVALAACEGAIADGVPRDRETEGLALQCLVNANLALGRVDAATAAIERLLREEVEYFGADNPGLIQSMQQHVIVLRRVGKFEEAHAAQRRVVELAERALGPDSREVADALILLGQLMHEAGRIDDGIVHLRRALAIFERTDVAPSSMVMSARVSLAQLLRASKRPADRPEMFEQYRAAIAIGESILAPDDQRLATVRASYGMALGETGDRVEALAQLDRAAAAFARAGNPRGAAIQVMRAQLLVDDKRLGDAIPLLEAAIVALEKVDVMNMLVGKLELASCLWIVDGPLRDRRRAHALVRDVRAVALTRGAAGTAMVASCDEWLASHPAPR
jgi:tetratricopeptide (TPR) repeat protein